MTGAVGLDGFRLVVTAGDATRGVVVRCPGVVLVARFTRPGTEAMIGRLVELCNEVAQTGPPSEATGRKLVRRVAGLLASVEPEEVPDFGLLVSAGERIAAFVHGATDVVASVSADSSVPSGADRTASGRHMRLSGAESATWLDRLLPAGVDRVEIGQTGSLPAAAAAYPDVPFPLDLRFGVVAGAGATLVTGGGTFGGGVNLTPAALAPAEPAVSGAAGLAGLAGGSPEYPPTDLGPAPIDRDVIVHGPRTGAAYADDIGPGGPAAPPDPWPVDRMAASPEAPPTGPPPPDWRSEPGAEFDGPTELGPAGGFQKDAYQADGYPADGFPAEGFPAEGFRPDAYAADEYEDPVTELAGGGADEAQTELGGGGPGAGDGQVQGLLCPNGHFNNPAAIYCAECDAGLSHSRGQMVWRPRPSLGVLVFDDGSTVPVDTDIVIGRQPERDDSVRAGRARPLVVEDGESAVSRVHADIHLDGWDARITDHGSANGTYIAPPDASVWTPLVPHQPSALTPGTRVQVGKRTFVFDARGNH